MSPSQQTMTARLDEYRAKVTALKRRLVTARPGGLLAANCRREFAFFTDLAATAERHLRESEVGVA